MFSDKVDQGKTVDSFLDNVKKDDISFNPADIDEWIPLLKSQDQNVVYEVLKKVSTVFSSEGELSQADRKKILDLVPHLDLASFRLFNKPFMSFDPNIDTADKFLSVSKLADDQPKDDETNVGVIL